MEKSLKHPPVNFGKTGVLIINLGTPDSTSWFDIRKYLKEFLSDRRVIEVNPIIWQVILNVFILTFRPSKTAKAYKEIWMKDRNISPLLHYTQKQAETLSNLVSKKNLIIDYDFPPMFIKRIFIGATPQICFGFLLTFSSSIGQTFFISLFAGEIRNELNFSHGMFGTLYSSATLISAIIFLWLGKLTDEFDLFLMGAFTLIALSVFSIIIATFIILVRRKYVTDIYKILTGTDIIIIIIIVNTVKR